MTVVDCAIRPKKRNTSSIRSGWTKGLVVSKVLKVIQVDYDFARNPQKVCYFRLVSFRQEFVALHLTSVRL